MTKLEPKEIGTAGNPFLRPYEAELSKARIIGEPSTMHTQFSKENDQDIVEIELLTVPSEKIYSKLKLKDEEIKQRTESKKRTWFINATSFNHLIKTLGSESKDWIGKEIGFDVEDQVVAGRMTAVIYAEGSLVEETS